MKKRWGLLWLLFGVALLFLGGREYVEPNLDEISRLKAKGLVTEVIGKTVQEVFSNREDSESYFIVRKDETGNVQMVQANTILMNQKVADLTVAVQEKYKAMEPEAMEIPIGTIFGSPILSQANRGMRIRVLPLSVSSCDFETHFESQGINQTKYQIYIELVTEVRVLQPFSHENFKVTNRVLLSELVIVGDVPENYVSVPEEDILDVT